MPARHVLQVFTQGLSTVIGVNRAHHAVDPTGRGLSTILPVNEWIMPEGNKLSILLSRPEGNEPPPGEPSVDAHLFVADPQSKQNDPLYTLTRFTWPLPAPAPSVLPFLADIPFTVTAPPPCKLWKDAPRIEKLTPTNRLEIVDLVESFRKTLDRRDADAAYSFMEYRYRDNAIADGIDYDQLAVGIKDLYRDMFAEPDLRSEPLTALNAGLSIVGGDRVVLVSRGLGQEAIRVVSGQPGSRRTYGFRIYVAKINGRWTIVR